MAKRWVLLSELPAWRMLYLSLTSSMSRPMRRLARSGAVLTETRLTGTLENDIVVAVACRILAAVRLFRGVVGRASLWYEQTVSRFHSQYLTFDRMFGLNIPRSTIAVPVHLRPRAPWSGPDFTPAPPERAPTSPKIHQEGIVIVTFFG